MTNIFNALENCLQQIENGTDIESVLKQYPELASELRPILKTALKAQQIQIFEPAPQAFRRGRAKVMHHTAELRTSQPINRKGFLPVFSRLAISFALAFIFLLSGTGLLSASASALPGERLYTVKRGWESARLFLIFDQEARELLKNEFENERLHEVNELISQGRDEEIQFAGIFLQVNGLDYVSGVRVIFSEGIEHPLNGEAVIVIGQTNTDGFVEVFSLEILQYSEVVPLGNPVQVEITPSVEVGPEIVYFEIQGVLQSISDSSIVVNSQTLFIDNPNIVGRLCIGNLVKVFGYYVSENYFLALEIIGAQTCDVADNSNENSNSENNTNDNADNSNNDNNSGNENNSNDDDSGSGEDDDDLDDND